jgi:hypothetical protein
VSAPCDRFEREALLELERGHALDPHFASCPDCLAAAGRHRALAEGLRTLAEGEEPPEGWRERVWEQAAARRTVGPRWWKSALVPAALAAAAALVLLLPRPAARPVSLDVDVLSGTGAPRRAASAAAGDRLSLHIPVGGRSHAELRLYRNDTDLVLRCSDQPPCRRDRSSLSAEVRLETMGRYQAVVVVSTHPAPPAGNGLDRDSAAALESGAAVFFGREVVVE